MQYIIDLIKRRYKRLILYLLIFAVIGALFGDFSAKRSLHNKKEFIKQIDEFDYDELKRRIAADEVLIGKKSKALSKSIAYCRSRDDLSETAVFFNSQHPLQELRNQAVEKQGAIYAFEADYKGGDYGISPQEAYDFINALNAALAFDISRARGISAYESFYAVNSNESSFTAVAGLAPFNPIIAAEGELGAFLNKKVYHFSNPVYATQLIDSPLNDESILFKGLERKSEDKLQLYFIAASPEEAEAIAGTINIWLAGLFQARALNFTGVLKEDSPRIKSEYRELRKLTENELQEFFAYYDQLAEEVSEARYQAYDNLRPFLQEFYLEDIKEFDSGIVNIIAGIIIFCFFGLAFFIISESLRQKPLDTFDLEFDEAAPFLAEINKEGKVTALGALASENSQKIIKAGKDENLAESFIALLDAELSGYSLKYENEKCETPRSAVTGEKAASAGQEPAPENTLYLAFTADKEALSFKERENYYSLIKKIIRQPIANAAAKPIANVAAGKSRYAVQNMQISYNQNPAVQEDFQQLKNAEAVLYLITPPASDKKILDYLKALRGNKAAFVVFITEKGEK